ncbi:hypothetical protein PG984_008952 [Apiospora sp. TS-2023a]
MTSMERQEGNIYGSVKEPDYGILTYTWGRWPAPGGDHISISGTTWAIPAVKESMFTVASFQNVIQKMGESHDFAWIDVACIDQENYAVKSDEIGRQVGIFHLAARVYVWLWKLSTTQLQNACDEVDESSYLNFMEETPRDMPTMLKLLDASLETLLGDWWFSSLWTLQEGILRPDAIILSREAEHVRPHISTEYPVIELKFLANTFWNIRVALETETERPKEESLNGLCKSIIQRIKRAGYLSNPFASNPNIQWGAARWRTVSSEQDRVYGIQAIYNIRVGDSAPNAVKRKDRRLSELQLEFTSIINAKSPLLGQMFVHQDPPPSGSTWQFSPNITVPPEFGSYDDKSFFNACTIAGSPAGFAQIEGQICFLKDIDRFWNTNATHRAAGGVYVKVVLDEYIVRNHQAIHSVPEDLTESDNFITSLKAVNGSTILVNSVLKEFGVESVSVLRLGNSVQKSQPHDIGLLLLHTPEDRTQTTRIGICAWYLLGGGTPLESVKWVQYQGILR